MEKRETISHLAQDKDEEMSLARSYEKIANAGRRDIPGFTAFLTLREQALLEQLLLDIPHTFFGGAEGTERKICVYLPEYLQGNWLLDEDGPIAALQASWREEDKLSHRDILGALMGCGVKRETVGDISVGAGTCTIFVLREMVAYLLDNFTAAGRIKLQVQQTPLGGISLPKAETKQIRDTVSSLRLDGIVSAGFSISRGKAQAAIEAGRADLNGLACMKGDKLCAEGDRISVRGMGKIRLTEVGGMTKKGRISVLIDRYI